ncbi:MAG: hypothetical protein AABX07_02850 [Nanoarchaeota archaeon]
MINQKPKKCQKCGEKEFIEFETRYKCKNCGKNHGKSIAKIYTGWLEEDEEWLNKNKSNIISSIRHGFKIVKTIDKSSKRSFTTQIEENKNRNIIQERSFR